MAVFLLSGNVMPPPACPPLLFYFKLRSRPRLSFLSREKSKARRYPLGTRNYSIIWLKKNEAEETHLGQVIKTNEPTFISLLPDKKK